MNEENKTPEEQEAVQNEETAEVTEAAEAAEEPTETVEETAEEAVAEAVAEETAEVIAESAETIAEEVTDKPEESNKKNIKLAAIITAAAVVVVAAIVVIVMFGKSWFNPYTKDYIDVTGKTIGDIADEQGMEYKDFIALYNLPSDMPASTFENAAYYNIPAGTFAQMSGTDFDTLKDILGVTDDDSITEDTTIGDMFDKATVSARVGDDQLDAFKAEYELDDSVTGDTLWGEVRNKVDQKLKEQQEAAANPVEETEAAEDDSAEATEAAEEATEAAK